MVPKLNMLKFLLQIIFISRTASLPDEALVMLSDILPTGYEIGVLKGKVKPGSTVAIVGAGPVGLATLLTAQFFSF